MFLSARWDMLVSWRVTVSTWWCYLTHCSRRKQKTFILSGKHNSWQSYIVGRPLKTNMSPENQWLEDVFHLLKLSIFRWHISFWGCTWAGYQFLVGNGRCIVVFIWDDYGIIRNNRTGGLSAFEMQEILQLPQQKLINSMWTSVIIPTSN